jgi:D-glycero-alpha-D-manno-heptose-7-phosphate kinase
MIISRTPVRVPLGGGGTDLPSYSSKHGGFVLSAAIDKYQFITVNRRRLDRLIRASYSQTEIVSSVGDVQHNLIREALRLTGLEHSIEISSIADVPGRSGMGGSGAFTVGLLHALHTLKREAVPLGQLAEEACHIEMDLLGEPIGKHDQYITAFGGIRCLDIDRTGHVSVTSPAIADEVLDELERNMLLFFTGIVRNASTVLAAQNEAADNDDRRVIESLHRIKEIGWESKLALERGDLTCFGELLHEHWTIKRELSSAVSTNQIDRWYDLAREHGARGGKIMGAGSGGFFMFYSDGSKDGLRRALTAEGLIEMRFRFDFEGSKILVNL